MSKSYVVGQRVIVKMPSRRNVADLPPIPAVVTKVGRVWGTATGEGVYPREWIFRLETGVEKGTETWQPVYVVSPEQAVEMDRVAQRDLRLREAQVFPYNSPLRLDGEFLDALDALVAERSERPGADR